MKTTKNKIIAALIIVAILVIAFLWGGGFAKSSPSSDLENKTNIEVEETLTNKEKINNQENTVTEEAIKSTKEAVDVDLSAKKNNDVTYTEENSKGIETSKSIVEDSNDKKVNQNDVSYSEAKGMEIDSETGKDKYLTDPVPEGKPIPVEPGTVKITKSPKTCTMSIQCKTILGNIEDLDKEKVELVSEDGVIMPATTVTFYEGESVFNLLQRETKKNKIHMEFENTPIYNSAYIEGIHNLYEFDCGELSGWMYKVNGWFPNYGCSRYLIQQGDVIEWIYTCDLGRDIGGGFDE